MTLAEVTVPYEQRRRTTDKSLVEFLPPTPSSLLTSKTPRPMQLASLVAADQDNNGRITFNEYIRALGLCIAAAPPIGSSSAMTELQFLMIDLNNNGAVDATELATFIEGHCTLFCEKGLRESGS